MRIQVLFFGGMREILACDQTTIESETDELRLSAVLDVLEQRFPKLRAMQANVRIALNEDFLVSSELDSSTLHHGDVLAFIPPVSGG